MLREWERRPLNIQVENIARDGQLLLQKKHPQSNNIVALVETVKKEWADLVDAARRKGEKLRQANEQKVRLLSKVDAPFRASTGHSTMPIRSWTSWTRPSDRRTSDRTCAE